MTLSVEQRLKLMPEKSVMIEIIIEKIEKKQTSIPEGMTLSVEQRLKPMPEKSARIDIIRQWVKRVDFFCI